jgi:hypothetical protein
MSKIGRYLTYRLGDNDFGGDMEHALRWMIEQYGVEFIKDLPDERILATMANHMAGETMARHTLNGHAAPKDHDLAWYFCYFVNGKIDRTDEGANADGDGSYVSVDLSTSYIWRH